MGYDGLKNLLEETHEAIKRSDHVVSDVVYIGSRDGYACTWEEFMGLADHEYDAGFGGAEVAGDLEIHFQDGSWLERDEYDGSEWWTYREPLVIPTETKRIERLIRDDDHWDADGLETLHKNV